MMFYSLVYGGGSPPGDFFGHVEEISNLDVYLAL
jgi:hypothetical protein